MEVVDSEVERRRVVRVLECDVSTLVEQQFNGCNMAARTGEMQSRVLERDT